MVVLVAISEDLDQLRPPEPEPQLSPGLAVGVPLTPADYRRAVSEGSPQHAPVARRLNAVVHIPGVCSGIGGAPAVWPTCGYC